MSAILTARNFENIDFRLTYTVSVGRFFLPGIAFFAHSPAAGWRRVVSFLALFTVDRTDCINTNPFSLMTWIFQTKTIYKW